MQTKSLVQRSVGEFLDRVAAKAASPAGESVAALTGALAAALGRMAAGLLADQPDFVAQPEVRGLADRLARADQMFRRLVDESAAACGLLSEALQPDCGEPARPERVAQAAGLAGAVSLEAAALSSRMLSDLRRLRELAGPQLGGQVEAADHLAQAVGAAAIAIVRDHLARMGPADAQAIRQQLAGLRADDADA